MRKKSVRRLSIVLALGYATRNRPVYIYFVVSEQHRYYILYTSDYDMSQQVIREGFLTQHPKQEYWYY